MVKNLSQLKKALKNGTRYEVVEHFVHPKYTGQVRQATYVGTDVMYSRSVDDDSINTLNGGHGIKTDFGKASDWAFCGGVCQLWDSRRYRPVMTLRVLED